MSKTTYNGFWNNGKQRIAVIRTSEEGYIRYRIVDENGKKLSELLGAYAEGKLPGFIKEGSNCTFQLLSCHKC